MKNNTMKSERSGGRLSVSKRYHFVWALAYLLVIAALTGCDEQKTREIDLRERINDAELVMIEPENKGDILRFGFDLRGSPDEDAMQYLPFLKYLEEEPIKLSPKENELLRLLALHENDLMPRELALTKIWRDDNYFTSRSMDVYIAKLRKYLKRDDVVEILNIHGEGFRLVVKTQ